MADKIREFLDHAGLATYDGKIKEVIDSKSQSAKSGAVSEAKTYTDQQLENYETPGGVVTKINEATGLIIYNDQGEKATTVKAYVDEKTSGIATDSALNEVKDAVASNTNDITTLKTAVNTTIPNTYQTKTDATSQHTALEEALNAEVTRAKGAEEANAAAAKTADDKAAAAQTAVDTLAGKVGTVPANKTVVQMISDAQTAATYDDTQIKADIKANADAIGVLTGDGEGSVDKKITDAFNDFSAKVTDDAVVNSYKELIDWAAEHGSEAAEMAAAITALQNILAGIGGNGESATVVAYVTSAIEALKIGDYAKVAELTALAERVTAMEAKVTKWDAAEQNAKDYADGLNATMSTRVDALETASAKHALATDLEAAKSRITTAEGEIDELQDEMAAVKSRVAANETSIADLKKADQGFETRIAANESAKVNHETRIAACETDLASFTAIPDSKITALFA